MHLGESLFSPLMCILLGSSHIISTFFHHPLVKLAHDDLEHNGSARTYMILRRNYYWKGLRPDVVKYVKSMYSVQETQFCITKIQ